MTTQESLADHPQESNFGDDRKDLNGELSDRLYGVRRPYIQLVDAYDSGFEIDVRATTTGVVMLKLIFLA